MLSKLRRKIIKIAESKPLILRVSVLVLIFTASLIVRFYPVFKSPEVRNKGLGLFRDTHLYHRIAYNLYKGHGFSGTYDGGAYGIENKDIEPVYEAAAVRGPGYPVFLCAVYRILGRPKDMKSPDTWRHNWDKVRIIQCILDSFVCLIVYFIVSLIYTKSYRPALISAFLYAFCFYNIFYARALLSESLTTFLLTLCILFCVLAIKKDDIYWWIVSGIGFGLVILTKSEYMLFPFIMFAYILFANRGKFLNGLKRALFFIVSTGIIIFPWTLRNYIQFGEFIAVSRGTIGYNLFLGTFESNENWQWWEKFPREIFNSEREKQEVELLSKTLTRYMLAGSVEVKVIDNIFMKLAIDRIRSYPLSCIKNWITKIPRLWYQNYIPMWEDKEASGGFFVFYFIFLLFGCRGSNYKEKVLMMPVLFLFGYLTFIFFPLHVEPRYSVPLMPGIICLTGIGIWKLVLAFREYFYKN